MKVTVKCRTNKRFPGVVYAQIHYADELLCCATLAYCLMACKYRGYTIENADELLHWMAANVDFKARDDV